MNDDETDIDNAVRDLVRAAMPDPVELEQRRKRSFDTNRDRLRSAYPRKKAPRNRRAMIAAIGTAGALLAGIAIAPDIDRNGSRSPKGIPPLTPSASASEVLAQAGTSLLESGASVGTGDVWHGASRTYRNGELVATNEQWFDPTNGTYLAAAYGVDEVKNRDLLLIDRIDADNVHRVRTYERPDREREWTLASQTTPHVIQEVPLVKGARERLFQTAMNMWLRATLSTTDVALLDEATDRFISASRVDAFEVEPPEMVKALNAGTLDQSDPLVRQELQRQLGAREDTLITRQILYLLTTVQVTPETTNELYKRAGGLATLERLTDVTIDGEVAWRLRFDQSSDVDTPYRERVLVLHGTTGRILRTEALNRKSWTDLEPAQRVDAIAEDAYMCATEGPELCDILNGRGTAVEMGNSVAKSEPVRRSARFIVDSNSAFSTAKALTDVTEPDGLYRSVGHCSRDVRWLTTCRG